MKPKIMKYVTIGIGMVLFLNASLFAQRQIKSTGIGFRASYWSMNDEPTRVKVSDYGEQTSVQTGNGGGWLYLISRMNKNVLFELSLGTIGSVDEETNHYVESDVDVFAITPLLCGLRYELFSPANQASLKPYLSCGVGPYWITNIQVKEQLYDDEVTMDTRLRRGGYLGGGANFLITDWLAINFDLKYHFINFNSHNEHSGYDYGFGVSFMWGKFNL